MPDRVTEADLARWEALAADTADVLDDTAIDLQRDVAMNALHYCGSLDAAVAALNALGLGYIFQKTHDKTTAYVNVWRPGGWRGHREDVPTPNDTPAALATALVQAALKVLGEEETDG